MALIGYCVNKKNGCNWTGEVRKVEEHSKLCGFVMLECPRKCQEKLLQMDLQCHLEQHCMNRDYECPYCGEWGLYGERITSHLEKCPNRPTPCPNQGCQKQVAYQRVEHHALKDCDCTIMRCRYKPIGCHTTTMRRNIDEHEDDDKHHLRVALSAIAQLRKRLVSTELLISSSDRQYLPRLEAKKLKGDIKQGIEKIHTKCETLQLEVNDLFIKDNMLTEWKKSQVESYQKEANAITKRVYRIEQECKQLEEQAAELRKGLEIATRHIEKFSKMERASRHPDVKDEITSLNIRTLLLREMYLELKQETEAIVGTSKQLLVHFDSQHKSSIELKTIILKFVRGMSRNFSFIAVVALGIGAVILYNLFQKHITSS